MKIIITIISLAVFASCKEQKPVKTGWEGNPIPAFNMVLMDSTTNFNTQSIPTGEPIVFFYMSPNCPYCRAQTEEIVSEIRSLKNTRLYIVSNWPFGSLKEYYKHYNLNNYPNITVGMDKASFFANYYKVTGVPYMIIFNKEKKLQQVVVGKTSTSAIKEIIFNHSSVL